MSTYPDPTEFLQIPLVHEEYAAFVDSGAEPTTVINQMRIVAAATTRLLSTFRVFDFVIFSLFTDGTKGYLCYSYKTPPSEGHKVCKMCSHTHHDVR